MKFGLGLFSMQAPSGSNKTHRELYRKMLEQVVVVEEIGFDSTWLVEHHFREDGGTRRYSSLLPPWRRAPRSSLSAPACTFCPSIILYKRRKILLSSIQLPTAEFVGTRG